MRTAVAVGILSALLITTAEAKNRKHRAARHHAPAAQTVVNPFFQFPRMAGVAGTPVAAAAETNSRRHRSARHRGAVAQNVVNPFQFSGMTGGFAGTSMIATAQNYAGRNPTGRSRQWCGEFMALVARQSGGRVPEGYAKASNWAKLPRTTERVGAVAVMPHHVGIVTGRCENGGVKILSGNFGRAKVGEGCVSRGRIMAFVQP
jgi:hypothetical protein